jgi:hypothetical protein
MHTSLAVYRFAADHYPDFIEKLKVYGGTLYFPTHNQMKTLAMRNLHTISPLFHPQARYKRTMPAEDDKNSPIGRSFYNTYQVNNKLDLEKKLSEITGLEYEWTHDGSLTVTTEPIPGEC